MREEKLHHWLSGLIKSPFSISPLKGDASFRCYCRVNAGNKTFIAMDAPPEKENCLHFVQIAQALREHGLNAPEIIAQNLPEGFLLLSDFGDETLDTYQQKNNALKLYQSAIDNLICLQNALPSNHLAPFDKTHMRFELSLFEDWYLKKHLSLKHYPDLTHAFDALIEQAASMSQVAIHRDYHSRNLMVTAKQTLGILDFQDMMRGPILYDLVSLLKDCYVDLGCELRDDLVTYYLDNPKAQYAQNRTQFIDDFNCVGLIRHLKAAGIFCRLNYRDNKKHYLKELPLTLKYIADAADSKTELTKIQDLFHDCITH